MSKKKRTPKIPVTNPDTTPVPLDDALINPLDVEGNTNWDAVNYDPSIGWVQPLPLKEIIRRNKESRLG